MCFITRLCKLFVSENSNIFFNTTITSHGGRPTSVTISSGASNTQLPKQTTTTTTIRPYPNSTRSGSFGGRRLDTDAETGSVYVDLLKMDEEEDDIDYDHFSSGDDNVKPETRSSRHPSSTLQSGGNGGPWHDEQRHMTSSTSARPVHYTPRHRLGGRLTNLYDNEDKPPIVGLGDVVGVTDDDFQFAHVAYNHDSGAGIPAAGGNGGDPNRRPTDRHKNELVDGDVGRSSDRRPASDVGLGDARRLGLTPSSPRVRSGPEDSFSLAAAAATRCGSQYCCLSISFYLIFTSLVRRTLVSS